MEKGNLRQKAPVAVTRAALYEQVWSRPLVQLASSYKTTTIELARICALMKVPRPPSGYWLKKSSGKIVAQEKLPPADTATPLEALITPATEKPKLPSAQLEFENQLSIARAKYAGLDVPEDIGRPHP